MITNTHLKAEAASGASRCAERFAAGPLRTTVCAFLAAALTAVLVGCSAFSSTTTIPGGPLTDEETKAQVADLAVEVIRNNRLELLKANFYYISDNDQTDPPFAGSVSIIFSQPANGEAFRSQIATTMESSGWSSGAKPGEHFHGSAVLNKDNVTAVIGYSGSDPREYLYPNSTYIDFRGEYRNTNEHAEDSAGFDITDELKRRAGMS